MKIVLYGVLVAAMLFGFFCLNYTKSFGVEQHYEFAEKFGIPAPSGIIYWIGVIVLAGSSGVIGFLIGKSKEITFQ